MKCANHIHFKTFTDVLFQECVPFYFLTVTVLSLTSCLFFFYVNNTFQFFHLCLCVVCPDVCGKEDV